MAPEESAEKEEYARYRKAVGARIRAMRKNVDGPSETWSFSMVSSLGVAGL